MEYSDDWKSYFPVYSAVTSPLLLSGLNTKQCLGPLVFNSSTDSLAVLSSSSTTSVINPSPRLSLPRFLTTTAHVPPSTTVAIASNIGPIPHNDVDSFSRNRLCLLHVPRNNYVFAFFPTGDNSNQVGFSVLGPRDGCLVDTTGAIHIADIRSSHSIFKIVSNPVAVSFETENYRLAGNGSVVVGYILACTTCCVHLLEVGLDALDSDVEKPVLAYLGNRAFKSSPIVDVCWSPDLEKESVVLLESGELFLLERRLRNSGFNASFKRTKLRVTWEDSANSHVCKFLAVDFSWDPRILIVARTDAVFMIDLRDDESGVSCLMKIDILGRYSSVDNNQFLAFRKAGSNGLYFTLASNDMLILCDVRRPLKPVLQWDHGLEEPRYIDVYRMSELRSQSQDDTYKWASEYGFGIILGSFWTGEFSLFCYGPPPPSPRGSFASKIPKFCESLYAWGLPSGISLSGRDCLCGSCLLEEEYMKNTLPEWIDWQEKKEFVLGFGILNKNVSTLLSGTHEFGGFTMVRLMSSGKLESQRYCASQELVKKSEEAHQKSPLCFEDNLLHSIADKKYKFDKRFKYVELDYLHGYLNGNLGEVLHSNLNKPSKGTQGKTSFDMGSHEVLCEKLKLCGFGQTGSFGPVVYNDVSLPTSIREVTLRRMWMNLPVGLLQLAFSSYSEFLQVLVNRNKVSLEFLPIPELPQPPPFYLRKSSSRSNKWSNKVQRGNGLMGPLVPLPIMLLLLEFQIGLPNSGDVCSALDLSCKQVMQDARKMAIADVNDDAVNLGDDGLEMMDYSQEPKPFVLYNPAAFECPTIDDMEDESFRTLICKVPEKEICDGPKETAGELFDSLSPVVLKFDDSDVNFGLQELKAYNMLKGQYSKWKQGFD